MYERAAIPDPCPLCKNSMGFETLWCIAVYIPPLHIDTPENGMDPLRSDDKLSLPPPSPATSPSSGTPHPSSDCCRTGEDRKDIRLRGSRFWCISPIVFLRFSLSWPSSIESCTLLELFHETFGVKVSSPGILFLFPDLKSRASPTSGTEGHVLILQEVADLKVSNLTHSAAQLRPG